MALALIASALGPPAHTARAALNSLWFCWTAPGAVSCNVDLASVAVLSNADAWAVGEGIVHWDGVSWQSVPKPSTEKLNAVSMVDAQNGWAVGQRGTLLRWDGSTWTQFAAATNKDLLAVDMISATDGWAVGASGVLLRWNGSVWTRMPTIFGVTLRSVSMLSGTSGWVVAVSYTHLTLPTSDLV